MKKYVAYLRISNQKSGGIDSYGIAAQEQAIASYNGDVIATYMEVESGRNNKRPELRKALDHCKRTGATLLVGKLDRLARSIFFISQLMESKVDFVCCDMPDASRLTIQLLAVIAEHEARTISERTKKALAVAKERGVKLGNPNLYKGCKVGRTEGQVKGGSAPATAIKEQADLFAQEKLPMIKPLIESGLSLHGVAKVLNGQSIKTARGKDWTAQAVKNVLNRNNSSK